MNTRQYNHKVIQSYIEQNNITIKKFCELCDISYSQYRKILNDKDVHVGVLMKIVLVLKIPFCEMFKVDDSNMFDEIELYN